jgi:hypothetical protein
MKSLDPQSPAARHLAEGRYVLRNLDTAGLAACPIPWMREAGWNPGLRDAETFITADPLGFLVGELDGQPIATVSGVRYDDTFGFIGCYIVAEPFRGQGYGLAIHEAARRHLAGCTQGGDGVLENVQKYQRIGRVFAHRNARHEFMRPASLPSPARPLTDARSVPLDEILTLDRACFPAPRRAFLQAWIHQPGATALAIRDESGLAGYGVIRPCFRGWKIGPLFAKDPATAEDLFRGLLQDVPVGTPCVLDIPEPNEDARQLVARHTMSEVFATARMYTGPFPKIQTGWVYGITTFELG